MEGQEKIDISLRTLILALIASTTVSFLGLTIYILFRDSNPTIAVYGSILIFAGVMPFTVFLRLLIRARVHS